MTVCFFGHYNPHYSRNRVLKKGLIENGVKVRECNDFGLGLLLKYLRFGRSADVIFVAFPGNEDMPLAWILGKIFHKQVVLDAFISRFDTKVLDRKEYSPNSLKGRAAFFWDWIACLLADKVLLDTQSHINFFVKAFSLPRSKLYRVYVGTDESVFYPRKRIKEEKMIVGFHGYYIPLQGAKYIVEAAYLLRNEKSIEFRMLGKGPDFNDCLELVRKLKFRNVKFLPPVSYESLPEFIAQTDIYLGGPFGGSGKAGRVIPNKVFEALAMKKPVIVGETKATKELLTHLKNCYMVKRTEPKEIAMAIMTLKNDKRLRVAIAGGGYRLFRKRLTTMVIGEQLANILQSQI